MRDASQSADAADADLAWSVFDRRGGEGGREWQSKREVAAQLPVSPPPSLSVLPLSGSLLIVLR